MRRVTTVLVAVLGLSGGASAAPTFSGILSANYGQTSISGSNTSSYGGNGSVLMSLRNPGFNIQLDGSGASTRIEGASSTSWSAGGNFFFRDAKGAMGFSSAFSKRNGFTEYDASQFGVFGEWYARSDLTLRIRGGGMKLNGDYGVFDNTNWFGGVGAEYYLWSDLGIAGQYDYSGARGNTISRLAARAEYQLSHEIPVSLSAGYEYATGTLYGVDKNASGFMLRLSYRFGTQGSLVAADRTGPLAWSGLYLSQSSLAPVVLRP